MSAARACQGRPSECSTCFSDVPADQSQDVLEIASGIDPVLSLSEHGPCLVEGTVTLDDVSFTAKIAIHSGGDVIAPCRCVALLDTGSPKTFIRRDVLDRTLLVGADSAAYEIASCLVGSEMCIRDRYCDARRRFLHCQNCDT